SALASSSKTPTAWNSPTSNFPKDNKRHGLCWRTLRTSAYNAAPQCPIPRSRKQNDKRSRPLCTPRLGVGAHSFGRSFLSLRASLKEGTAGLAFYQSRRQQDFRR